jgi:hypothetical protein
MGGTLLRPRGREGLRPAGFGPEGRLARLRTAASKGGGAEALTLDDVIADAWRALSGSETARCPLCGGEMNRGEKAVAGAEVEDGEPHGECVDCGTQLF